MGSQTNRKTTAIIGKSDQSTETSSDLECDSFGIESGEGQIASVVEKLWGKEWEDRQRLMTLASDLTSLERLLSNSQRHDTHAWMSRRSPDSLQLSLFVQAPDFIGSQSNFFSKNSFSSRSHILITSGQDDDVCFNRGSICEVNGVLSEVRDFLTLLDLDLSFANQFRASDVKLQREEGKER